MHILIVEYWQSMHLTIRALDLKGEDAIVQCIEILRRAGGKISVSQHRLINSSSVVTTRWLHADEELPHIGWPVQDNVLIRLDGCCQQPSDEFVLSPALTARVWHPGVSQLTTLVNVVRRAYHEWRP